MEHLAVQAIALGALLAVANTARRGLPMVTAHGLGAGAVGLAMALLGAWNLWVWLGDVALLGLAAMVGATVRDLDVLGADLSRPLTPAPEPLADLAADIRALEAEGFVRAPEGALQLGHPEQQVAYLARADGTLAEVIQRAGSPTGISLLSILEVVPERRVLTVRWRHGSDEAGVERYIALDADVQQTIAVHDRVLARLRDEGLAIRAIGANGATELCLAHERTSVARHRRHPWLTVVRWMAQRFRLLPPCGTVVEVRAPGH